jgi:tryptophan-rich sensory protein
VPERVPPSVTGPSAAGAAREAGPRLWFPHQHGAWAMLAVPLLLGVAASRADAWQLVLAAAAVAGYLASATWQAWLRARRRPSFVPSLRVYGIAFALLAVVLVVAHPGLVVAGIVVVPAAAFGLAGARPGARREIGDTLAQLLQAIVLTPAAAYVSGAFDPPRVAAYTIVAAAYLVGTVLVVRSVIRERGNTPFAIGSIGFHLALVIAAAALLPPAWVVVAVGLALRAAALPWVQRRRAGTAHPLRTVQVGAVEAGAAIAVVVAAFVAPL